MAVITMLTDFGSRDHYVGVMKGVILGIGPAARLVDLTHEVDIGDVAAAGFILASAWLQRSSASSAHEGKSALSVGKRS